jgi:2-amino-4-hydroxy-6-hydroxymethyldihydropteridine diphosphokinase
LSAAVKVYLSLGSNISPEINIPAALAAIEGAFGEVLAHSSAWQSAAVGAVGLDFLNAAVLVHSPLSPTQIKTEILRPLEARMGRVRTEDKNAPRTIDIDILLYGDQIVDETLWRQAHLAVPLAEIYPGLRNPDNGQALKDIAAHLLAAVRLVRREDVLAATKSLK